MDKILKNDGSISAGNAPTISSELEAAAKKLQGKNMSEIKGDLYQANMNIATWIADDTNTNGPGKLDGEDYIRLQNIASAINTGINFLKYLEVNLKDIKAKFGEVR